MWWCWWVWADGLDGCGSVISSKDNRVDEVTFEDGDYADFDEEGDVSVCIYKMRSQFCRG